MSTVVTNSAAAQTFRSNQGLTPKWIAAVGDATMTAVVLSGDHVKQQVDRVANGASMTVDTDSGSGDLKLTFVIGGAFQEYVDAAQDGIGRDDQVSVFYYVPLPANPSIHYGMRVGTGSIIDLGEAVRGQTIISAPSLSTP